MVAEGPQRRSRVSAPIIADLRSLRLAMGLALEDAAALTGESKTLLQAQESAGLSADAGFVDQCLGRYLDFAYGCVRTGQLPEMVPSSGGASAIYRFRGGLGLPLSVAAQILRTKSWTLEALEDASRGFGVAERRAAWCEYADWAYRSRQRTARRAVPKLARPRPEAAAFASLDAAKERAAIQRVAYARQPSPAEAEAFVLRYLDGS